MTKSLSRVLFALSVSFALAQCGGSPASQPTPAVVATPTPAPTPTPKPLSVIRPCALPASNPAQTSCTKPNSRLEPQVQAAVNRVLGERPDLFNFEDVDGGPRILNYDAYMTAVVAAINEQPGFCARIDPEGEIGIKNSNSFNEQWLVASKAGWNPPAGNWVWRKYVGACSPSTF